MLLQAKAVHAQFTGCIKVLKFNWGSWMWHFEKEVHPFRGVSIHKSSWWQMFALHLNPWKPFLANYALSYVHYLVGFWVARIPHVKENLILK